MRLFDQHVHSWNSFDAAAPPAESVERALEVGLAGLSFTEHFDTHPDEWKGCVYDDAKIEREIASLRVRHGDRLFIGKGIEVCYQPDRMDFILDMLGSCRFDVVLLSVHWVGGKAVHVRDHFRDTGPRSFIRLYLEAVRDATADLVEMKRRGRQPFNVLGHMDFARRYTKRYFGHDEPVDEPALVDEIARNCLAADVIPEANTSTLRHGMASPMPGFETIRRYVAQGGTTMSLGSDSHSPETVGGNFGEAIELLASAGIRQLAVFKQGRLCPQPLSS